MPDYRDENLWLMQGDCLDRMAEIPDGSVDMILADLPYGTTACKWDVIIPFEPLWAHYKRICKKNAAIVLTASQPFTSALVMSNPNWFRHEWVWDKRAHNNFCRCNNEPLKRHENVLVFADGDTIYNPQKTIGKPYRTVSKPNCVSGRTSGTPPKSTLTVNDGDRFPVSIVLFTLDKKIHPTQKPVALGEYLIKTYTNEGETVLDNTMGSGSFGVAAIKTGRRFIGIEKDTEHGYFEKATDRILSEVKARQEQPALMEVA